MDTVGRLPPPLPAEQIIALNQPKADPHTLRAYEWNGGRSTCRRACSCPERRAA
ncbi:hypothetical protein [Prauserella sp. PE36]|uniref:hypothetical protein n=1 Tax=Prauserella sp. PE36 TaxID=1504709 RepID=UPI001F39CB68|nr:hypothetical protein [Prauserella sp. PE36]